MSTPARPKKRARRTQGERSAAMRERLLHATVECLVELGYARTTTTAVVQRARVSRGAQLHHFPTKADLVATAVEYVMERRNQEVLAAFSNVEPSEQLVEQVIDALWGVFSGPTFYAWLELLVAARTDVELRGRMNRIAERFTATVDESFRSIFQLPPGGELAMAPRFTFLLLEGMALERIRGERTRDERRTLRALKNLAPLALAAEREISSEG